MVKRKSTPKKKPDSPNRKRQQTKLFFIQSKTYKLKLTTLNAIKKLQTSTSLCIPRLPFSRLIKEILMQYGTSDHRIQIEALRALQEAAELYLTYLFEDANRCATHAKRITLIPKDMRLVLNIKGCTDPGFT